MITKEQLLTRLEVIKDSLSDCDGMERWSIEGVINDISVLMNDIDEEINEVYTTNMGEA